VRVFWTDRDNETLVREHYPQFLDFYRQLTPGIKMADFARFLYMHRFGGGYVDLDFVSLKNPAPLSVLRNSSSSSQRSNCGTGSSWSWSRLWACGPVKR